MEPTLKKKRGAKYFELDEDINLDWIKEHQAFLIEEQKQKIQKKFEKDNEKLVAEGEKEMKATELKTRLEVVKDLEKKYNKENKTGKVEAEGKGPTVDKIDTNIGKLEQRIENMELQAQDKEDNKEVALGTSKIVSPSHVDNLFQNLTLSRTTLIPVSPSCSARNLMCPWRSFSPSPCGRNSNGPSSLLTKTGSSKPRLNLFAIRDLIARLVDSCIFVSFFFPISFSHSSPFVPPFLQSVDEM